MRNPLIAAVVAVLAVWACGEKAAAPLRETPMEHEEAAGVEAPGVEQPVVDTPAVDAPVVAQPAVEASGLVVPVIEVPGTEEPSADGHLVVGPRVIEVIMSEFAFSPSFIEVAAGETVTFRVTNEGVIEHEFRLIDEEAMAHHDHDHGHEANAEGVFVMVQPGDTAELTLAFGEDVTFDEFACLIPGHYEAGMEGVLTVVT